MKLVVLAALCIVSVAGCAALQAPDTRRAEEALVTAGFEPRLADTPEKQAQLAALPARRVVRQSVDGEVRYVYADPTNCKCLYVGGDTEYQRLRQQEQAKVDRFFAVD